MEEFSDKILLYGAKKDLPKLQQVVLKCSEQDLENYVKTHLTKENFARIWDYLLKAFQDSRRCHNKRIKVVLAVLNELENRECVSSHLSTTVVQRLCMDLTKLKTEHLVEICNFCLASIQSKKSNSTISFSWKDLLPDTLRILNEKDQVDSNDLTYTGQEFKTTFISTICMSQWCPDKITQITAMFSDMPLNKDEHLKVVTKLSSYIEKLTPQEVPSFTYQLLRLCRTQNSRIVFLKLQDYFQLKIYNVNGGQDSETPDFDLIERAEDYEALQAEGVVLYHIENAASLGHGCIKDYLTLLKNTVKSPNFVLQPFQLLALFTIATVSQYEEAVFEVLRLSVVRCYNEQLKKTTNQWYRDVLTESVVPEDVFKQLLNVGQRDMLLESFINFGFTLLNVGSALGRDVIAEKQWALGAMILLKIIKKQRDVAGVIIKTFCNHILTKSSATQYIDTLFYLVKSSPQLLLSNRSNVSELLESLIYVPAQVACQLLEALIPLTKFSSATRDQLIMILRKSLYSRSIETRQVAVHGYVKLITQQNLTNSAVWSQTSSGSFASGHSLYTQISVNTTSQSAPAAISSEALCWEVLGILKRCFIQQAEVRATLYDALYQAVCINPELGVLVLEMFWFHLMDFYVMDENAPALNMTNVAVLRETDCLLHEPLSKFIFALSHIVAKVGQMEDYKDTPTVQKYVTILESLCNRMANSELVHFSLDDGTDLTDQLPESQQKLHILREIINIFDALIGYKIASLSPDSDNQCTIINTLLEGQSRFVHFGRTLSKQKKKTKASKSNFKIPDTILDLATVDKALRTLLEPTVGWVSTQQSYRIRTKFELHQHFIRAAYVLCGRSKSVKSIDGACQRGVFDHLTSVAEVIYNRIVLSLSTYVEFDCPAAVQAVECFSTIVNVINVNYKKNLTKFLSKIGGKDKSESLVNHLKPIMEKFQEIFEMDHDELSNDVEIKRLSPAILNIITGLSHMIPADSNIVSVQLYDWLKRIAYHNEVPHRVAANFMSLLFETHIKYKSGLSMFEQVAHSFVEVYTLSEQDDSIDEPMETLKVIDVATANSIFPCLCNFNKMVMDDVDSLLVRIKSDHCITNYLVDEARAKSVKTKEKAIITQLCFISRILRTLTRLAIPAGSLSEVVFKNVVQFYSILSNLTKFYISTCTSNVWFEKLVKLSGKALSKSVYTFLYQLEKRMEENQGKGDGAAMKNKVLRETKTIPKVIYEMEQFSRFIIQLTKRTKCDLSKYVGQGISRDFRILAKNLPEDLADDNEPTQANDTTQTDSDGAPVTKRSKK